MDVVFLLIGASLGWLLARMHRTIAPVDRAPPVAAPSAEASSPPIAPVAAAAAPPVPSASPPPAIEADPRRRVLDLAKALASVCERADQGRDLENEPDFIALRTLLAGEPFSAQDRLNWITSQSIALSCAALAAMSALAEDNRRGVVRVMGHTGYMAAYFALKYLAEGNDPVALSMLLLQFPRWWTEHPATRSGFIAFLDAQTQRGVKPATDQIADDADWTLEDRKDVFAAIAHPMLMEFLLELEGIDRMRRGRREVARVGHVIQADEASPTATTAVTTQRVAALVQSLQRAGRQSLVVVGSDGVGKTTLARAALSELGKQGWHVVEATPAQLISGQKYVGEIEQRVENFIAGVGADRAIWFVPECHQLLEKGTWTGNPHGVLDLLLPHLERRSVQILGESTVAAWTRVVAQRPRVDALIASLRIEPLGDQETRALVRDWSARWREKLGQDVLADADIAEACELARQQFPQRAEPGRTLELLKEALAQAQRTQPPALPLTREALLAALARSSGLPLAILDQGRPLDVADVREYFSSRVMGQDEAVDCLVDRISMLKAGLTDPQRPIGVFLFAGPTGTGKTEIAKTLASYLFGSPDRMLRFDMSEYQSDDAYWRLLDDGEQGRSASLTTRVRQTPFAVILLDEFEKASPRIWDLFLQVFDDGRLTDRSGNTADFRHSIIILTSNLGATIDKGAGVGFVGRQGAFSRELVTRSIDSTFRREFINRLDRVIVFNPLTRALMRDILQKELRSVLERRGFRSRDWAVEWEPSALEFLLDKGFTPDLGARPLRRAIDQYLLAPLARTMVEHRVPHGEQFLFVQGQGDRLGVRFVDPDAPIAVTTASPAAPTEPADLRALALDPRVDRTTLDLLEAEIRVRLQQMEAPEWMSLKEAAARAMQRADFWQHPDRPHVLDRLERMDRIESGLHSVGSLLARLNRSAGRGAADLVRRIALTIAAIDGAIAAVVADEPEDARLLIKPGDPRSIPNLAWRDRIAKMYTSWAENRGMRVRRTESAGTPGTIVLEVTGFAPYPALRDESGAHVLESLSGDVASRYSVRVNVTSDAAGMDADHADAEARLCRRYDDGPAPLVRDYVRGWRSGRLDRVLAGDFDLLGSLTPPSPRPAEPRDRVDA